jgi:hypothetical protein
MPPIPLNQFKAPPIIPILMDALGISVTGAGLLMSVFAVTGLILALPAGFIFQKAGYRVTGLLAGGSTGAGAGRTGARSTLMEIRYGRPISGISKGRCQDKNNSLGFTVTRWWGEGK